MYHSTPSLFHVESSSLVFIRSSQKIPFNQISGNFSNHYRIRNIPLRWKILFINWYVSLIVIYRTLPVPQRTPRILYRLRPWSTPENWSEGSEGGLLPTLAAAFRIVIARYDPSSPAARYKWSGCRLLNNWQLFSGNHLLLHGRLTFNLDRIIVIYLEWMVSST